MLQIFMKVFLNCICKLAQKDGEVCPISDKNSEQRTTDDENEEEREDPSN